MKAEEQMLKRQLENQRRDSETGQRRDSETGQRRDSETGQRRDSETGIETEDTVKPEPSHSPLGTLKK